MKGGKRKRRTNDGSPRFRVQVRRKARRYLKCGNTWGVSRLCGPQRVIIHDAPCRLAVLAAKLPKEGAAPCEEVPFWVDVAVARFKSRLRVSISRSSSSSR